MKNTEKGMNVFARNKMVAYKVASKKTGLTYEEVKAAYKKPAEEKSEIEVKASKIVHAVLKNYANAYKAAHAENAENAPAAVEVAVAE